MDEKRSHSLPRPVRKAHEREEDPHPSTPTTTHSPTAHVDLLWVSYLTLALMYAAVKCVRAVCEQSESTFFFTARLKTSATFFRTIDRSSSFFVDFGAPRLLTS